MVAHIGYRLCEDCHNRSPNAADIPGIVTEPLRGGGPSGGRPRRVAA